ncbi:MAG: dockerin type I repeat-containing protein [Ruminococcus sp.]|nr:dockerin type I repeat-containing protein [Ruminococcus sp.]
MRVYAYATSDRDGKYACSNIINVIPPLYPRIDMMTPGAVIPEGEDEVQVAFETNFGFTDYELIADGETAAEYHNDRILYEDVVPVSKDMVGKQLMIRVTCLKNEEMGIDEETVVESQLFEAVLPDSEHKFTSQPHDMDISAGIPDDQTWSTNFTPVRLCVMSGPWAICEFEDPGDLIGIGPTEWFKTVFNGESRLRAYYGEGPLDYVESCIINTVCPEFTIDPTGGYIHEGETLNVEWETNFTPKKVELWTDSEFCKELEPDAASIELDGKGVGYYNILAYYSDDVASGVFSSGFAVKLTDQQIYTITVPDDVRISYGAGYLTRNALAGENVDIFRTSSEPVFSKWVCKSGNAEFDDEYSEYTYFTMPSGDVVIDYETAEDEQPTSDEDYPKGDVNGDGEVNVTDVVLVAAHVKSIRALFDDRLARADVNHDDDVNVTDLTKIAAHVKGIKTLE